MMMKSHSSSKPHPLLAVVNNDGMLLVIGDLNAQMDMTPKQMRQHAMELLKRAEEAEAKAGQE